MITGIKGSFVAILCPDVVLDVRGDTIGENASLSWKHAYFPLKKSIEVKKGETIEMQLDVDYSTIFQPRYNITVQKIQIDQSL